MLRPNFVRNQVADLATLEKHVQHLVEAIQRNDGASFDIQALFFRLTLDSATEFLFGESTDYLVESDAASSLQSSKFATAFERSQHEISRRLRSGFLETQSKQFKADVKFVHDFVDRFVKRGLEYRERFNLDPEKAEAGLKGQGRYVFMNELVKRVEDPVRIRSELLNIMLAGRDTTASLLGNTWFVLARRPDIWKKLRQEVEELKGEKPTFEQIKNMKYLKAVLNECTSSLLRDGQFAITQCEKPGFVANFSTHDLQPFGFIPWFLSTVAWPSTTQCSQRVVEQMVKLLCSYLKGRLCRIRSTQCTDEQITLDQMLMNFGLKDGRI